MTSEVIEGHIGLLFLLTWKRSFLYDDEHELKGYDRSQNARLAKSFQAHSFIN